jgi:hypothetical protein
MLCSSNFCVREDLTPLVVDKRYLFQNVIAYWHMLCGWAAFVFLLHIAGLLPQKEKVFF